jgi:hypothetical protein
MNIFIDESGSFVNAPSVGAFNTIAAYMSPESDRIALQRILVSLKRAVGARSNSEIKLKHLSEQQYFNFLSELSSLSGALYAVATDSGLNHPAEVAVHQAEQVARIVVHKDKMHYQAAKEGLLALSTRLASLSPQLYVQLQCQVNLIEAIIRNGILYFVQRKPKHLGAFRWRIDQKNSTKTEYETAFQQVLPAYLQTISLRDPMPMLIGADYSAFSRFDWAPEEKPTYLRDAYGLEINEDELATNIGMLVRENLEFVDSQKNQGVQVADLLASGLRRCLRCEFSDNDSSAFLLGRLMVQNDKGNPPVQLLGFSKAEVTVDSQSGRMVRIMERSARAMLVGPRRAT